MDLAGDIWSSDAFSFESPLKTLLDSGSYTLEELLEEDELLQELRGMNNKLRDFFSKEEVVLCMVKYVTCPPEIESETSTQHIRYPYMSCEIFCCEINEIIDTLVEGCYTSNTNSANEDDQTDRNQPIEESKKKRILDLLFSMLCDTPIGMLDDYRAGYLDKILSVLFRRRPAQMLNYVKNFDGGDEITLMKSMFSHLYSHSVMNILQSFFLDSSLENGYDNTAADPIAIETFDFDKKDENNRNEEAWHGEQTSDDECLNGEAQGEITKPDDLTKQKRSLTQEELKSLVANLHPNLQIPDTTDDGNLQEIKIFLAQNTSQFLVTALQDSPSISMALLELALNSVVKTATSIVASSKDRQCISQATQLTCTLNVLENIVLQIGQCGTYGAESENASNEKISSTGLLAVGQQNHVQISSSCNNENGQPNRTNLETCNDFDKIAASVTLCKYLPQLLTLMSDLLHHQSETSWCTQVQYQHSLPHRMLGTTRIQIIRFIESLVLFDNHEIDLNLCNSDCLEICTKFFFDYRWCAMLHQSFTNMLVHVLEGGDARSELQEYFLIRCNLLHSLMDSFETKLQSDIEGGSKLIDCELSSTTTGKAGSDEGINERQEIKPFSKFRSGHLGYVITICQTLLNAKEHEKRNSFANSALPVDKIISLVHDEKAHSDNPEGIDEITINEKKQIIDILKEGSVGVSSTADTSARGMSSSNLVSLLEYHPLRKKWQVFSETTFVVESTPQSKQLGSGSAYVTNSDLHRSEIDVQVDDNDLDIAASMIQSLNMHDGQSTRK